MPVSQFKDRVDVLLTHGLAELSMTLGVLARVDRNSYEIVAVQSNSGAYVAGEKYALGESFSRKVCEKRQTIAESDIDSRCTGRCRWRVISAHRSSSTANAGAVSTSAAWPSATNRSAKTTSN